MERIFKLLPLLVFSIGCQTISKTEMEKHCDPLRNPAVAGVSCLHIFQSTSLLAPKESKIKLFFDELEKNGFSNWQIMSTIEAAYSESSLTPKDLRNSQLRNGKTLLRSVTPGRVLAERRELKESTAKTLTELGYIEQMGQLMPPRNLPKLYEKIYERILNSARQKGIDDSNVILPALIFRKENEIKFVRPGIDQTPSRDEGWKLSMSHDELSGPQFSQMIRERKMALEPGMFFHDIGHIIDFIERPHYMPALIKYEEAKAKGLGPFGDAKYVAGLSLGPVAFRGDLSRYFYEWLYLPAPERIPQIKEIIPDLDIGTLKALAEYQESFVGKKSKDLLKTAKTFLKNRYTLFSSHGGGARDWSVERHATYEDIRKGFEEILESTAKTYKNAVSYKDNEIPDASQNKDQAYRIFEAPELFRRLEYLVQFKEGKDIPSEIMDSIEHLARNKKAQNLTAFVDYLIAIHLAEIQFRIHAALVYKITPEKIVSDTALLYFEKGWQQYQKTDTYLYYSTYRRFSVQWYYAVDVARELK